MKRQISIAFVVVAAAALAAVALGAPSKSTAQPSNVSPPSISGSAQVGNTLTADHGNWNGSQPLSYQYHWQRCDANGGSCSNISGQTAKTYVLKSVDQGNTLRVRVVALNTDGSSSATSVPTAKVSAASTTPAPSATGCPSAASGATVAVTDVSTPARLQVTQFAPTPGVIGGHMTSFTVNVKITDTCGQPVSGALVYATAVPFRQVNIPAEQPTGSDGSVTLTFDRLSGFPATAHQQLMVMYIRARKPGDNVLAGITTGRLVSIPVRLAD
jgi:phospholipase/lecithinase/hemolysin